MLLSAEIRWFWRSAPPSTLLSWFKDERIHLCAVGGGPPDREDLYLVDGSQSELGIKVRGQKNARPGDNAAAPMLKDVEAKGLLMVDSGVLTSGPLAAPVQFWCKWPFRHIDVGSTKTLAVRKTRWLRRFDTTGPSAIEIFLDANEDPIDESRRNCLPALGCNAELTEVQLPIGDDWWTFGVEAFGPLHTLEASLRTVAEELVRRGDGPELHSGVLLNYPQWINQYGLCSQGPGRTLE